MKPKAAAVEQRVADAIQRMASLDAREIWATTDNGTVHLYGNVHSLWEKKVAEEAAASAGARLGVGAPPGSPGPAICGRRCTSNTRTASKPNRKPPMWLSRSAGSPTL